MRYMDLLEYKRDITIQKMGDALVNAARSNEEVNFTINDIMLNLEYGDPTKNKKYVVWLAKNYIAKKFRLEDTQRIHDALEKFEELKPRLPVEKRDIGRMDLHQLELMVDNITGGLEDYEEISIDGLRPREADNTEAGGVVMQDSKGDYVEVLYKGPLGLLVIPYRQDAACKFGSGTKWCTSAKKDNAFQHYNKQGPLFIWQDKTGKYQFHFESSQFMTSRDTPIPKNRMLDLLEIAPIKKLFTTKINQQLNQLKANNPPDIDRFELDAHPFGTQYWRLSDYLMDYGTDEQIKDFLKIVLNSSVWREFGTYVVRDMLWRRWPDYEAKTFNSVNNADDLPFGDRHWWNQYLEQLTRKHLPQEIFSEEEYEKFWGWHAYARLKDVRKRAGLAGDEWMKKVRHMDYPINTDLST